MFTKRIFLLFLTVFATAVATVFAYQPDSVTTLNPQKIIAADGSAFDEFGSSISSDGNTLVIGASQDGVGANPAQGSVYVFVRNGANWVQQAQITASDGSAGDNFGNSVAVYGDVVAVGAPNADTAAHFEQGAVYIFNRSGANWFEQAKLVASDAASDQFGGSVAMNQNTLVIGATGTDTGIIFNHGSAYVFTNVGGSWIQQTKLNASDFAGSDNFGGRVDIDNGTIVVGASLDDIGPIINQGSAYIFAKSGDVWIEQAKLTASDGAASDFFGVGAAISGNTVIIGAPDDEAPTIFNQGSAYVFVRQNGTWSQQTKLTAPDAAIIDRFGVNVDIAGNTAIIGMPEDDINADVNKGSAFLVKREGNVWSSPVHLFAPDGLANDNFGSPVALGGENRIFAGMPSDRIGNNANQGSVYYFLQPTVAPDLRATSDTGISNADNITNSTNLVFDVGGVTSGATIDFLRNGTVISSATATGSVVTFNDSDASANGIYQYSARQIINGEAGTLNSTNVTVDMTAPVITINQLPGQRDPASSQPIFFSFTFSEPLLNFDASDISLAGSTANVSAANIQIVLDGAFYRVSIGNILSDGIVQVSVQAGAVPDAAGNPNSASVNIDNTVTRDTTGPSVSINQAIDQADPTAVLPIKYTVVFSEPVTGFNWEDVLLAGSTASVIYSSSNVVVTGSGTTYTIAISGVTSNGQFVQANVRAGAVQDAADNQSFASTTADNRITVDNVSPTVMINQSAGQPDPASAQPMNFSVVFSEPITNFDSSDISLVGSTANVSAANIVVTGSGTTFNVAVSNVTSNGQVRASIAANAAQDGLGNLSRASTSSDNVVTINQRRTSYDFDGDGKSEVSVFRPENGFWHLLQSNSGYAGIQFGNSTDKIVPADYDGDGKTDIAVFRSGTWYLQRSGLGFTGIQFGASDDIPVPADYDGDGKADVAVFRPSNGTWYLLQSTAGFTGIQFGQMGDKPVAADYDGDGKADVAVNRTGIWYILRSTAGFTGIQFGTATDKLVPADYDGDGKADVAVFRDGIWYLQRSQLGFTGIQFGQTGDLPTPADYDGDGRADVAVFREGTWYLNRSTQGFAGIVFGTATDIPVPNAFVR